MQVWRIGKRTHPVFDGTGAMLWGARWNGAGRPVIYAATTYALALLEILAHAQIGKAPPGLRVVDIDIPDDLEIEALEPSALPGWADNDYGASQRFGNRWIAEARTAVLLVPSVLSPVERNAVLNPRHPDFARINVSPERDLPLDARLQSVFGFIPPPE